ncbi:hypothetical protein [Deinococcus sp. LM3]|uniref:hypothetical protein n=1 Tax=Deinococcus sp. LM3 TaxID=1938608 RepID=UPI00117E4CF2|nr:hypothetical protein [Deinococcus sp. LM3]
MTGLLTEFGVPLGISLIISLAISYFLARNGGKKLGSGVDKFVTWLIYFVIVAVIVFSVWLAMGSPL